MSWYFLLIFAYVLYLCFFRVLSSNPTNNVQFLDFSVELLFGQQKFFFRICEVQDVNLILCQVFPGEVLPNLGGGEYYPACA